MTIAISAESIGQDRGDQSRWAPPDHQNRIPGVLSVSGINVSFVVLRGGGGGPGQGLRRPGR